ncbi:MULTISPECIES: ABC transporter ATP-binding protein [unclassified Bacillus (in: firmicutes)]|uniref:ABC transporter ATP-binding protein n=1 Tax=unclassified Bacillus (in: firmicutes) TaxID=185979 RepID=UPI002570972E|nr:MULTISPECIES: ABC transporter ATP-binding protein [unclassified Bacillus (in: firmicutes)]
MLILFFMMIISAMFETVGIGLIVPFVGIVTNPTIIKEQVILKYLYNLIGFKSTTSFLIFSVFVLLFIYIIKNSYILFFQYCQNRVIMNQQIKLSRMLFNEYLKKPYTFHLQRNTALLLRNVNEEVSKVFQQIIISGFLLVTELLVIFCILVLLLVTSPMATIVASVILSGSVYLFLKAYRKKMSQMGKGLQSANGMMIKWVNQGLGASKEVKVSGRENFFVESYSVYSKKSAVIKRGIMMFDQVPRLFIETLIVSIVLIIMLVIIFEGTNISKIVSTMALFAMAAFRLMPSINRVIAMIAAIRFNKPALSVIYEDLFTNKDESLNYEVIENKDYKVNSTNDGERIFKESIDLKGISFRYPNQNELSIKDISLTIPIGQSIAFIGESGAGKTTLVDIILGLFRPEKGSVSVDGIEIHQLGSKWQKNIGYIPQSIFLSDDTVRGNIAFGIPSDQIDEKAVWKALEQAQLKEFVESLPDKLETAVGERGVRLSGGQRQRIGIARALYHNPEIIFMDEATSALDNETEKEIISAIDKLKGEKTLIIIAHRLTTIENCDIVFKINKGKLTTVERKLDQSVI